MAGGAQINVNDQIVTREMTVIDDSVSADLTAANNVSIDTKDFIGRGIIVLHALNVGSDSDETLDVSLQDSADDVTFAAISPAVAFTQIEDGRAFLVLEVDFDKVRRFIALFLDVGGTTPDYAIAASIHAHQRVAAVTHDSVNTT